MVWKAAEALILQSGQRSGGKSGGSKKRSKALCFARPIGAELQRVVQTGEEEIHLMQDEPFQAVSAEELQSVNSYYKIT